MTRPSRRLPPTIVMAVVLSCARYDAQASDTVRADSSLRARQDSVNRAAPGYIVDSILPIDEEIRRFTANDREVAGLSGGAGTRAELVRRFGTALARRDTAALLSLLVTRAEFGHLVFPESPYVRAPYKTKPLVIWMQLVSESERGVARLLQRAAGDSVRIGALRCEEEPERQGDNRYWRQCSVVLRHTNADAGRARLFGPILQRGHETKFLSYATDF